MNHHLYILSVWLHILSAMLWIGGMLFLVIVLVPAIKKMTQREIAIAIIQTTGRRFRTAGWICFAMLFITGYANLTFRGIHICTLTTPDFWKSSFGQTLGIKLTIVAIILIISLIHDFSIGPKATEKMQTAPGSPETLRLRRLAAWFGRLNVVLALVVVLLGIILVRGNPWS